MTALCLAAVAGCGRAGAPDPALPAGGTAVYTCTDEVRFSARVRGDSVTLAFPEGAVTLPQVRAASGAKYSAGDTTFWSRGSTAILEAGGRRYTDCGGRAVGTPWEEALHLGVDFRAVGQEPGWTLDLDEGRWLRFLGDYGGTRVYSAAPRAEPDSAPGSMTLLARDGGRELRVEIREEPCRDAMSGESYRHSVRVRLDDRTLEGCGRMLRSGEITGP